jgi:hypothetical protein
VVLNFLQTNRFLKFFHARLTGLQNNELLQLSRTTKKKTEKERGFSLLFFRPVN